MSKPERPGGQTRQAQVRVVLVGLRQHDRRGVTEQAQVRVGQDLQVNGLQGGRSILARLSTLGPYQLTTILASKRQPSAKRPQQTP